MENRRNFVMKIAGGMSARGFMKASEKANNSEDSIKNVFVHHVFFWLKEPNNPEVRQQFEEGLTKLVKVPQIQTRHLGTPTESSHDFVDNSFTYSFLVFFRNKEDQNIYKTHPIHLNFIEDYQHLWEKVIVYDAMD